MKMCCWACGVVGVAAAGFLVAAGAGLQNDRPAVKPAGTGAQPQTTPQQPAETPTPEDEMAAWMAFAAPGEHHKHLEPLIGTFKADCTWYNHDGTTTTSTGVSKSSWALGGRFVKTEFTGDIMGEQFEGFGMLGYDNIAQQYVGTWYDTMMTGILIHRGSCSDDHKTFEMAGEFQMPGGVTVKDRNVTRIIDANTHSFEMFHTGPDGQELKVGTIIYTRQSPVTRPRTN